MLYFVFIRICWIITYFVIESTTFNLLHNTQSVFLDI